MWTVVVTYRTYKGKVFVPLRLEYLSELEGILNQGPDIKSIQKIDIQYNDSDDAHWANGSDFENLTWDCPSRGLGDPLL